LKINFTKIYYLNLKLNEQGIVGGIVKYLYLVLKDFIKKDTVKKIELFNPISY